MAKITETSTNIEIAQVIIENLQSSGVNLELDSTDNSKVVVSTDSTRDLTESEEESISKFQEEITTEVASKIDTTTKGEEPKRVFRVSAVSADSGIEILQGKEGSQGVASINGSTGTIEVVTSVCGSTGDVYPVCSWNGQTGTVVFTEYVSSFNGSTGVIEGVSSVNGSTGAVTISTASGVSSFNGATGAIDTSTLVLTVAGLSAGTSVQTMNGLVINQGNCGDQLSIAIGGTALIGAPLNSDGNSFGANIAIGNGALGANTIGRYNTAIGYGANNSSTNGTGSIAIGHMSATDSAGSYNTSIGYEAFKNGRGDKNVAIGHEALFNAGQESGKSGLSDKNVAIGVSAGHGLSYGDNNVFIGYDSRPTASEVSNQIAIGNTSCTYLHTAAGISAGGATFGSNVIIHGGISANAGISSAGNMQIPDDAWVGVGDGDDRIIFDSNGNQITLATNQVLVNGDIAHNGDINTKITFQTDNIRFNAGGVTFAYGYSGDFVVDKGITVSGHLLSKGGISANAGISASGRLDVENTVWAKNGISADHAIVTSHTIAGAFGKLDSTGMSANVGISSSSGLQLGAGISANAGISASGVQLGDGSIVTGYTDTIGIYITNNSEVLTTGKKGRRVIPYDCTVTEWVVTGSTAGSITWDVNWGKTSAWPNALASVGFSGDGSAPQLGATASQSYVLIPTAWTKSGFSAGDIIQFEIDSVSTITDCELALKIKRMDGT